MAEDKSRDLHDIMAEENQPGAQATEENPDIRARTDDTKCSGDTGEPEMRQADLYRCYSRVWAERGICRVSSTARLVAEAPRERLVTSRCAARMRRSFSSGGKAAR